MATVVTQEFKLIGLNRTQNGCSGTVEHFHTDIDYARCTCSGTKQEQHALFAFFKGGESFVGYSALVEFEKTTDTGLPIDGRILKILPPEN